jgi:hypothetical protein
MIDSSSRTLPHPIIAYIKGLFDSEVFNVEGLFDIEWSTFWIEITSFDIVVAKNLQYRIIFDVKVSLWYWVSILKSFDIEVRCRGVSDVPQNVCNLEQNPNNVILFFKIKKIVKFAGTAQSSSGFPKTSL